MLHRLNNHNGIARINYARELSRAVDTAVDIRPLIGVIETGRAYIGRIPPYQCIARTRAYGIRSRHGRGRYRLQLPVAPCELLDGRGIAFAKALEVCNLQPQGLSPCTIQAVANFEGFRPLHKGGRVRLVPCAFGCQVVNLAGLHPQEGKNGRHEYNRN